MSHDCNICKSPAPLPAELRRTPAATWRACEGCGVEAWSSLALCWRCRGDGDVHAEPADAVPVQGEG